MKYTNNLWKHPLLLMIMGFILTNVVGTRIITSFNVNEFKSKQRFLYEEKMLDHQLEVSEEFISSINDYQSKSMRVIWLYWWHCNVTNLDSLKLLLGDNMWNKNKDLIKYKSTIYYESDSIERCIDSINSIINGPHNLSSNYLFSQLIKKEPNKYLHNDSAFDSLIVQTRKNYSAINDLVNQTLDEMSFLIRNHSIKHIGDKVKFSKHLIKGRNLAPDK